MISKAHEKRLQYFSEAASAYFWEVDADLRFTYFSPRALDILGYPPEHFIGKSLEEAGIRKDIGDADWRRQVEVLEARQPFRNLVVPRKRPDGATIYVSISGVPVLDDSGRFEGYCGTTSDVTERYRAEEEIRVAQEHFVEAIEALSEGFLMFDADERFIMCNTRYREMYAPASDILIPGVRLEDWIRACTAAGLNPDAKGQEEEWNVRHLQARRNMTSPRVCRLGDRYIRRFDYRTASGGVASLRLDITEAKMAMLALKESESLLRSIIDNIPSRLLLMGLDGRFLMVNEAFARWFGKRPEDFVGGRSLDYNTTEHAEIANEHFRRVVERRDVVTEERDMVLLGGRHFQALITKFPVFDDEGNLVSVGSFSSDISQLKAVEKTIRDRERQLRLVIDSLPVAISYLDAGLRYRMINRTGVAWHGRPRGEIIGRQPGDTLGEQYQRWKDRLGEALEGREVTFEHRIDWGDGVTRDSKITYVPHFAEDGAIVSVVRIFGPVGWVN